MNEDIVRTIYDDSAKPAGGNPVGSVAELPTIEPLEGGLSREYVATFLEGRLKKANDARQLHFDKWKKNTRLLNNDYDNSKKQDWQSKGYVPKLSKQAGYVIGVAREAIVREKNNWADIDGTSDIGKLVAPIKADIAYDSLEKSGFVKDLKPGLKGGLSTSAILYAVKPAPEPDYPGHIAIDPVDMRCVVRDPTGRGKWLFWTTAWDYADVARLAPSMGWDPQVVASLKEEYSTDPDSDWKRDLSQMLGSPEEDSGRHTVYLSEYYGPIENELGEEIYRFAHCILANGKHLLKVPQDKPYGDLKGCITGEDLDPSLGAPYGKAYLEDASGPAEYQTKLYNMMFDHASFNVPMYQANRSDFYRPEQLKTGVRGGKIWILKVPPGPNAGLQKVDTNTFSGELLNLYALNANEIEEATSATEIARGTTKQAGGEGTITATEYAGKKEGAGRSINAIIMDIEDRSLVVMWERILDMIGRYADITDRRTINVCRDNLEKAMAGILKEMFDPKILDLVIDHIAKLRDYESSLAQTDALSAETATPGTATETPMPPEFPLGGEQILEAYLNAFNVIQEALKEKSTVRVRSLTGYLDKQERASRLGGLATFLLGNPLMASQVDPRKIFKALCLANDIDVEDLGPSDEEYEMMMEQQAAMQEELARTQAELQGAEEESAFDRDERTKQGDQQRSLQAESHKASLAPKPQGGPR